MRPSLVNWWHDVHEEISRLRSEDAVFSAIARFSQALGFTHCAYGLKARAYLSRPLIRMYDSYPRQWSERYRERDYVSVDPTVKLGYASRELVIWCDKLFSSSIELWHEARDHGLKSGFAQPSWVDGGTFALLSMARDSEPISTSEAVALQPYSVLLAETASIALGGSKFAPTSNHSRLTRREVEVLRWSANGKTAYETSVLLGVTEATVNFHVQNVMKKLGVTSKIQAVVLAVSMGLLTW